MQQVEFPADLTLDQSDGWHIQIPVSGTPRVNTGPGQAVCFKEDKNDPSNGTARGGMFGNQIDITIDCSNGGQGKYVGQVSSDAFAFGKSRGGWTWRSTQPMTCLVESAPPGSGDPTLVPEQAGTIPGDRAARLVGVLVHLTDRRHTVDPGEHRRRAQNAATRQRQHHA